MKVLEGKQQWKGLNVTDKVIKRICSQCTQTAVKSSTTRPKRQCDDECTEFSINNEDYKILKSLLLSPKSHAMMKDNEIHFGACIQCHEHLKKVMSNKNIVRPPPNSLASGLATGQPPSELKDLNPVELALISKARVSQHMFSFAGGSHKKVSGYHQLHYNKCDETNMVGNYVRHAIEQSAAHQDFCFNELLWVVEDNTKHLVRHCGLSILENHIKVRWQSDNSVTDVPIESVRKYCTSRMTRSTTRMSENNKFECDKFKASVKVILTGPFTDDQRAMTLKATDVNFDKCKQALLWLKEHNHLYDDIDVNDTIAIPVVIDFSENETSGDSNIENKIVTKTIFPDHQFTNTQNGGLQTAGQFKMEAMEKMMSSSSRLIARPTVDILKDYQGDSLLKAFVLQFPFGLGECAQNVSVQMIFCHPSWCHLCSEHAHCNLWCRVNESMIS